MAGLGYGPDSMVFTPDQFLVTRMAGGLGQLVSSESGREMEVGWTEGPGQELPQNSRQLLTLSYRG